MDAFVDAVTLGGGRGHAICLKHADLRGRATVRFVDLKMIKPEFSNGEIPLGHPDNSNFRQPPLHLNQKYDLAICDEGTKSAPYTKREYGNEKDKAAKFGKSRLHSHCSGLARTRSIKVGGTLVTLLHAPEGPGTLRLVWIFHQCAGIQLFKPT